MQSASKIALRFTAAAVALACGWGLQLFLYVALIRAASPQDAKAWATLSGIYSLSALLLVGVPVAVMNPSAYAGERRKHAILMVGAAGAGLAMVPPAGALFILTVPLGFVTGATAMWAYVAVLSEYPGLFGVLPAARPSDR